MHNLGVLRVLDNDRRGFLGNHVYGADDVEVGNLGEDAGVDYAQPIDALDSELGIQGSVRVVGRADGDRAARVVAPRGRLDPVLDGALARDTRARRLLDERAVGGDGVVEYLARELHALIHALQVLLAPYRERTEVDVGHVARVGRAQRHCAGVVARVRLQDKVRPRVDVRGG